VKPTLPGYLASCELIFCFLATLICDFCRIVISTVQENLDSCELNFRTLVAWKSYFCRVVKQTVQGYIFSCKLIFCILGAWKCDFCRVVYPLFKGTSLNLSRFSSFLRPENAIFSRRETNGSREHTFVWVHFLHFGGLKMRYLRSHETHGAIFGGS